MAKLKRKRHKIDSGKDEDVELEAGRMRVYFRNRYSLISLINDFLLGIVYMFGSIVNLLGWPSIYSTYLFLAGGLFLTLRPVLKIMRNVSIYKDEEYIKKDFVDVDEEQKQNNVEEKEQDTDTDTDKDKDKDRDNNIDDNKQYSAEYDDRRDDGEEKDDEKEEEELN